MSGLVVLEDALVRQMLNNPNFTKAFPFMAVASKAAATSGKKACTPCQAKQRNNVADLNSIKARIASLPTQSKQQLKGLLRTQKVRVYFRNSQGLLVKMTF